MARKKSIHKAALAAAAMAALAVNTGCEWLKAKPEEQSKGIAYRKSDPTEPQPVSWSARIADAYTTMVGFPPTSTATVEENLATAVEAYAARTVNNRNVAEIMTKTAELARLFSELEGTPLALPSTYTAQMLEKNAQDIFKRMNLVLGAESATQTAAVTTTGTARWDVMEKVAEIATRYNSVAKARALDNGQITLDVTLRKEWEQRWTFSPVTSAAQEPGFDLMKTVDGKVVKLDSRSWTKYKARSDADSQAIQEYTSTLGVTVTAGTSISLVEGYDARDLNTKNTYLLAGTKLIKLPEKYGRNELDDILQRNAALEQDDVQILSAFHQKGLVSAEQLKKSRLNRAIKDRDFGTQVEMDYEGLQRELEKYFTTPKGEGAYGRIGVTFEVGTQVRELGLTSADNPQTYLDAEIPLGEHLRLLGSTLTAQILAESEERERYFTPGDNLGLGKRTEIIPADKAERLRLLNRKGKQLNGWHEANPHQLNPTTWDAMKGKTVYILGYQKFPGDGKSK